MAESNSNQLLDQAEQVMAQAEMAKVLEDVEAELAQKEGATGQDFLDGMAKRGYPLQLVYIDLEYADRIRKG